MGETRTVLDEIAGVAKPVFGMVHFQPLPGSPLYDRQAGVAGILKAARRDAEILIRAGFDGLMFSNEGDRPYLSRVSGHTIALMARMVHEIAAPISRPFGVSVLADPRAAISVGAAVEAAWIRIFLSWVFASDWGWVAPDAGSLQRYRVSVDGKMKVFANVSGHTVAMGNRSIRDIARGAAMFGLADAVCLAGTTAGSEIPEDEIREAREAAAGSSLPVIVGTGVREENLERMMKIGDGFIVGTHLKRNGNTFNEIDEERAGRFMKKARELRGRP